MTIFSNDSQDIFITVTDKYRLIEDDYEDLNFVFTPEEDKLLQTYTGQTNKRVKLFWIEPTDSESTYSSELEDPAFMEVIVKSFAEREIKVE